MRSVTIAMCILIGAACHEEAALFAPTRPSTPTPSDVEEVATRQSSGMLRRMHAGHAFACGIWSGSISCWGDQEQAALYGLFDVPSGSEWTALAGGDWNICALNRNGTHECWGDGWANPLVTDGMPASGMSDVSLGTAGGIGLMDDGSLRTWGSDAWGQLADMPRDGNYVDVAAGYGWACALRIDGQLSCWGIEDGEGVTWAPHAAATAAPSTMDQISPYGDGLCGWLDGRVNCWGASSEPEAALSGADVSRVDGAETFLCAIRNGAIECHGEVWSAATGWQQMAALAPGGGWEDLVCNQQWCCADAGTAGTVTCWGVEVDTQLAQ